MNPITQQTVRSILDEMADALRMPSPAELREARIQSRIAVLDYTRAYRRQDLSPIQTVALIESAWLHLEKAVDAGASRERLEAHFYRIRQRYAGKERPCGTSPQ